MADINDKNLINFIKMKYRLFIYGSSGSGKTSFLRQLIQGNGLQVSSKQKLSKFMSGSVSSAGQVIPTTVGVD
ncbi:MAG: ATP-binding protein, partial [Planctomycetaceae bacterium]|nr:ATP-binding protein [Planctomycetaceae bacterium]